MSAANHELSLWLDEPEGWQGAGDRNYLFADQPLGGEPGDCGGREGGSADGPGSIWPMLTEIGSEMPDFEPSAPLGREWPDAGGDRGAGYIAISRVAAAGLGADLSGARRGKIDTVTVPPPCLQHRGGRGLGWGGMKRSTRCSSPMSRLPLAWRKP